MDAGSINSVALPREDHSPLPERDRSAATREHAQINDPQSSAASTESTLLPSAATAPAPSDTRDESGKDNGTKSQIGFAKPDKPGQESQNVQVNADGDSFQADTTGELTDQERKQVEKLEARDREVRTHEEAHRASAGQLARGGPNYSYKTGADGRRYAVSGSVQIDTSEGRTPEETIEKAGKMRRAALAPADPSGADRAIAAKAARMEAQARRELAEAKADELAEKDAPSDSSRALDGSQDEDKQSSLDLDADRFAPKSFAIRSSGGQDKLATEEEPESLVDVFA